ILDLLCFIGVPTIFIIFHCNHSFLVSTISTVDLYLIYISIFKTYDLFVFIYEYLLLLSSEIHLSTGEVFSRPTSTAATILRQLGRFRQSHGGVIRIVAVVNRGLISSLTIVYIITNLVFNTYTVSYFTFGQVPIAESIVIVTTWAGEALG